MWSQSPWKEDMLCRKMTCVNQTVLISCLLLPWKRSPEECLGIYFFATSLSISNLYKTCKLCHCVCVHLSVSFWQNYSSQILLWFSGVMLCYRLWYSHQLKQVIQGTSNTITYHNEPQFYVLKAKLRTWHLIILYKYNNFYFQIPGQLALHWYPIFFGSDFY